eukprot:COSAG05_NODE_2002_length_3720_cov_11.469207_5_plen_204_part_00
MFLLVRVRLSLSLSLSLSVLRMLLPPCTSLFLSLSLSLSLSVLRMLLPLCASLSLSLSLSLSVLRMSCLCVLFSLSLSLSLSLSFSACVCVRCSRARSPCMYLPILGSHLSYTRCGLGSTSTDTLVKLVAEAGADSGLSLLPIHPPPPSPSLSLLHTQFTLGMNGFTQMFELGWNFTYTLISRTSFGPMSGCEKKKQLRLALC